VPIYEFGCSCGKVVEEEKKISERKKRKKCPECGKKMKPLISRSSFHLKGSGWYTTDYGQGSRNDEKTPKK